jgi:hypothetical protein
MICPPPTKINKILKLKQTENTWSLLVVIVSTFIFKIFAIKKILNAIVLQLATIHFLLLLGDTPEKLHYAKLHFVCKI